MKNLIIVTGGAGFVGSNLINLLLKKTKKKIISLDNYSSGSKKNHIISNRVKYIFGNTLNIEKILSGLSLKKINEPVLIVGEMGDAALSQCEELGHLMAAGLEASIF